MNTITILQPHKITFGTGCIDSFRSDVLNLGHKRLFAVVASCVADRTAPIFDQLREAGVEVEVCHDIKAEPTLNDFYAVLQKARDFNADSVVGIGGGSVLDVAKLVAAFVNSEQKAEDCFGTGFIKGKGVWLACLPTTAGTGSEVSPNAILLDESDNLKKGIVSEYLLADVAYADPALTFSVPAKVTADTGMDALTHCMEAYTNKFAHPIADIYALQGIKLIAANLAKAVKDGNDKDAREAVALGSLYGGLVLGPVNTAAVHALSYPLGGEFHIPHGLSNAVLLPSVMEFNIEAAPKRYAEVAIACGVEPGATDEETAAKGVEFIRNLSKEIGIPQKLTELGIPQSAVDGMAKAAMNVQRLLKNNPRPVSESDARDIYNSLY